MADFGLSTLSQVSEGKKPKKEKVGWCGSVQWRAPETAFEYTAKSDIFRFFVLFCFVLFCFVLFCFVLFCFVLFCFVLFCFVLFCFVLFCFVLFCLFVCFFVVLVSSSHLRSSTPLTTAMASYSGNLLPEKSLGKDLNPWMSGKRFESSFDSSPVIL